MATKDSTLKDLFSEVAKMKKSALSRQEGGNHYVDLAIQPVEFIHANNLGFCEGNVVKYVSRWKNKNGIADLYKAKHYLELLIELEELESEAEYQQSAIDSSKDPHEYGGTD